MGQRSTGLAKRRKYVPVKIKRSTLDNSPDPYQKKVFFVGAGDSPYLSGFITCGNGLKRKEHR